MMYNQPNRERTPPDEESDQNQREFYIRHGI